MFVLLDYNNISKFLNRILGIEVELQNKLFRYFTDTLTSVILDQKRRGSWDMGILGTLCTHIVQSLQSLPDFFLLCLLWNIFCGYCMVFKAEAANNFYHMAAKHAYACRA